MPPNNGEILKRLSDDGWMLKKWRGSHRQLVHPEKPGKVTVAGKLSDIPATEGAGEHLPAGRMERALRLRTGGGAVIGFDDRVQGPQQQNVEREVGDFVLYRADGQFAYQLAVVVDDAEQAITDVVRGADLLDSTARQMLLQRLLGYPSPRYMHVPVVLDRFGEKLSKQTGAEAVDAEARERWIAKALAFLGQPRAADLDEAIANWNPALVPRRRAIAG